MSEAKRKGLHVPSASPADPTLEARIGLIESFLRDQSQPSVGARSLGNPTISSETPPIKSRLANILDRVGVLCGRLDNIDGTIIGAPSSATTGETAKSPYSIPDQLSAIESLLNFAENKASEIHARF